MGMGVERGRRAFRAEEPTFVRAQRKMRQWQPGARGEGAQEMNLFVFSTHVNFWGKKTKPSIFLSLASPQGGVFEQG